MLVSRAALPSLDRSMTRSMPQSHDFEAARTLGRTGKGELRNSTTPDTARECRIHLTYSRRRAPEPMCAKAVSLYLSRALHWLASSLQVAKGDTRVCRQPVSCLDRLL